MTSEQSAVVLSNGICNLSCLKATSTDTTFWQARVTIPHFYRHGPPVHLIHRGGLTYICVGELDHRLGRYWLIACLAPIHYLNQSWYIVAWAIGDKFQRKSEYNNFQGKNAFENVFCKNSGHFVSPSMCWHSQRREISRELVSHLTDVAWSARMYLTLPMTREPLKYSVWHCTEEAPSHHLNQCRQNLASELVFNYKKVCDLYIPRSRSPVRIQSSKLLCNTGS